MKKHNQQGFHLIQAALLVVIVGVIAIIGVKVLDQSHAAAAYSCQNAVISYTRISATVKNTAPWYTSPAVYVIKGWRNGSTLLGTKVVTISPGSGYAASFDNTTKTSPLRLSITVNGGSCVSKSF